MIDPITKAVRDALPAPLLSQAQCHRVAVAVLRAVREPSEEAIEAGAFHNGECQGSSSAFAASATYRAMIDTLICELEKEPAE